MYNLAKMELYRLFKSISTWVLIAVTVVLSIFTVAVTKIDLDLMEQDTLYEDTMAQDGLVSYGVDENYDDTAYVGIYFDTDEGWVVGNVNIAEFTIVALKSSLTLILITIFTAMFVNAENKNGYIKNIAGQVGLKGKLIFAKLPAIFIFNVIIFALTYLTNAIAVQLIIGNADVSITSDNLKLLLVALLLHFAFSCLIMLLTTWTRSNAFGMTMGIIFASGLFSLLTSLLDKLINMIDGIDNFMIEKYTLSYSITHLSIDTMDTMIAVGICFFVGTSILTAIIINCRDVK